MGEKGCGPGLPGFGQSVLQHSQWKRTWIHPRGTYARCPKSIADAPTTNQIHRWLIGQNTTHALCYEVVTKCGASLQTPINVGQNTTQQPHYTNSRSDAAVVGMGSTTRRKQQNNAKKVVSAQLLLLICRRKGKYFFFYLSITYYHVRTYYVVHRYIWYITSTTELDKANLHAISSCTLLLVLQSQRDIYFSLFYYFFLRGGSIRSGVISSQNWAV